MNPQKFRKKPVTIEAMRYPDRDDPHAVREARDVYRWVEQNTAGSFEPLSRIDGTEPWPASGISIDPRDGRLIIATLEGGHWVNPGDWIIRGVAGEFYSCRDDIFRQTYEAVTEESAHGA